MKGIFQEELMNRNDCRNKYLSKTLVGLFEEQVLKNSDKVVLVYDNMYMTH